MTASTLEKKIFTIIKRNRKYFAAKLGGYDCKIVIDDKTDSLEPGTHDLLVKDVSVRTKYGTDLIFELAASAEEQKSAGVCTIKPQSAIRNRKMINRVHALGGRWDATAGAWVFSKIVEDQVEELDAVYNSNFIPVEIKFDKAMADNGAPFEIAGFELADASGRDSGAKLRDGVAVIAGGFTSGGSMKNWTTEVREGTVIRMLIPAELFAEMNSFENVEAKKL